MVDPLANMPRTPIILKQICTNFAQSSWNFTLSYKLELSANSPPNIPQLEISAKLSANIPPQKNSPRVSTRFPPFEEIWHFLLEELLAGVRQVEAQELALADDFVSTPGLGCCWWLGPLGKSHISADIYYVDHIDILPIMTYYDIL